MVRPSREHARSLLKRVVNRDRDRQGPRIVPNPALVRKLTGAGADGQAGDRPLVEGFPEYYRLSIHLALLVGGRIGESADCNSRDIDLDHRLRVRIPARSDDLGEYRLDETKTPENTGLPCRCASSGTYRRVLPRQESRHDVFRGQAPERV
ncbi:MAG: hypothetical protein ACLS6O_08975 [Bifidobacterium sp.]